MAEGTVLCSDVTELRATLEQVAPAAGKETSKSTEWTKVVRRGLQALQTLQELAGTHFQPLDVCVREIPR